MAASASEAFGGICVQSTVNRSDPCQRECLRSWCGRMMTLIIGTNRPGSNTRKVARHVEEIYAEMKIPLHVLDLAKLPPEIFSPTSYAEKPKSFQPFSEAVL